MIKWKQRVAGKIEPSSQEITSRSSNEDELVGVLITNMHEFLDDKSSSDDSSMPGLQSRGLSNFLSSDGSMPILQDRAAEDSSSSDGTMSCDEDGVYDDGEHCIYKARSLKQIIGTNARGIEEKGEQFSSISMALFKYSIMGQPNFPQIQPKSEAGFSLCQGINAFSRGHNNNEDITTGKQKSSLLRIIDAISFP